MDTQDSSTLKQLPEVRIDVSSKDTGTDKGPQDDRKIIGEVHEEGSSEGMATDKSSHDGCKTTTEVHEDGSLKGMATDKASQDSCKTTTEVHEEGTSEGQATIEKDFWSWVQQKMENQFEDKVPRAVVNEDYRSLFKATVKGNWKKIEKILSVNHTAMTAEVMTIESDHFTILDVAIMAARDQLVEKLVKHFAPKCEDLDPSRALLCAARGGRIRMVEALIIDAKPEIIAEALKAATESAPTQKEAIWCMARRLKSTPKFEIMINLIMAGHLDICLYLAHKFRHTTEFEEFEHVFVLQVLAIMTSYFRSGARLNFWEKSIYKFIPLCLVDTSFDDSKDTKMARALNRFKISLWNLATIPAPFIKRSGELKLRHKCSFKFAKLVLTNIKTHMRTHEALQSLLTSGFVLDAASRGISEIVDLCLKQFPELMWDDQFAKDLIKKVVEGRHVELFRLVSAHNPTQYLAKDFFPKSDLLETVTSSTGSHDVSGAAFHMQRELQWFQVLEVSSFPSFKRLKFQENGTTYWEAFVAHRKELLKDAGQWMKDTSSSCSLVATLIITVAFAATFTVPGGNDSNTGIPIFLKKGSFVVFAIADALALFCSVTATLMFLAILTSRYAIEDFRYSLPRKMVLGLTFLFLSLAFMLVAFASTLNIVLSERWKWIYIPITLLAAIPVVLFAILQLPLYVEMVESTFLPRLFRPPKR